MSRRRAVVALTLVLAALAGALGFLGVIPGVRGRYAASTPALAVAFRAKESCTCLFVLGRDESACRAWTRVRPDLASLDVDWGARAVTSRSLLVWRARARYVAAREGCRLEE
jgi:hypothetical protein